MNLFKKKIKMLENETIKQEQRKNKKKRWLVLIGFLIVIGFFSKFVFQFPIVFGASMEPTLEDEDILMINKLNYHSSKDVKRYDIVVFKNHKNHCYLIKRIYGLPGETIQIDENENIIIDGKIIDDKYGSGKTEPGRAVLSITLKENEFFVLGDNREFSDDSRTEWVGNVKYKDITGKITRRIYPNPIKFE